MNIYIYYMYNIYIYGMYEIMITFDQPTTRGTTFTRLNVKPITTFIIILLVLLF